MHSNHHFTKIKFKQSARFSNMLSRSTVTTAWRVLGLRIEETASIYGG
jgi:hypothetical protein